jgi:hypothetical protein
MLTETDFEEDTERLEEIEQGSVQIVAEAINGYSEKISNAFDSSSDFHQYLHEDPNDEIENKAEALTEAALDQLGIVDTDPSLMTSIDHKRTRYVGGADFVAKQLLLVDSKAEKDDNRRSRMQLTQTSMDVRQMRWGEEQDKEGDLPEIVNNCGEDILTTTILVKYVYEEAESGENSIDEVIIAGVPNGLLQDEYNPNVDDNIWDAGPNDREQNFRTRLNFERLENENPLRVYRFSL